MSHLSPREIREGKRSTNAAVLPEGDRGESVHTFLVANPAANVPNSKPEKLPQSIRAFQAYAVIK